jgi:hypothetical protein
MYTPTWRQINNYAIVLSNSSNTALPWKILLRVYTEYKRLVFPPVDRRDPCTPIDTLMEKTLWIANCLHISLLHAGGTSQKSVFLMSPAPTSNQKVRDNMYSYRTYDKLSPCRKLIANKEVRDAGSSLETDNQPNSIGNTFMKPDTFMKSNQLFQHTSSRISSRLHTRNLMRILILSSCILSSAPLDLFRSDCPTKSLCAFLIFSMHAMGPAALIGHDFISVTILHKE